MPETKLNSKIFDLTVVHQRTVQKQYSFKHKTFLWWIDLDELNDIQKRHPLLTGMEKIRPFSLRAKDHFRFSKSDQPSLPGLKESVITFIQRAGFDFNIDKVFLVTSLRIFGYTFNPVSFYYCYNGKELVCVLAEVNNTYGEQKPYIVLPSGERRWFQRTLKNFYVSPFIDHDTDFDFHIWKPGNELKIRIDSVRKGKPELKAMLWGSAKILNTASLLGFLLKYPFNTLRIIVLIHYHAFRLYLMKVPHFPKKQTDERIYELENKLKHESPANSPYLSKEYAIEGKK